jgi:hypothetical protein
VCLEGLSLRSCCFEGDVFIEASRGNSLIGVTVNYSLLLSKKAVDYASNESMRPMYQCHRILKQEQSAESREARKKFSQTGDFPRDHEPQPSATGETKFRSDGNSRAWLSTAWQHQQSST